MAQKYRILKYRNYENRSNWSIRQGRKSYRRGSNQPWIIDIQRNYETTTRADSITTLLKNNGCGGAGHDNMDKSYDTQLTAMKKAVIPNFKTYFFVDRTVGRTMKYNLFLPKNYKQGKCYSMVLFIPDASTVGKGSA
jgi:predicted peptidase